MTLERYAFDRCALDVSERRLSSAGRAVTLAPKAYDLLVALVRHAGHLVTKGDLLEQVWPECSVDEGILAVHISGLRKALGDTERPPRYIETVQRSGYRFMASVTRMDAVPPVAAHRLLETVAVPPRRRDVSAHVGQGRSHAMLASVVDLRKAEAAFRAAIDLDSTDAGAHAGLALVYCSQAGLRIAAPADAYTRAKATALRALALDDSCGEAHVALGAVMFLSEWAWIAAERSLLRALALNPDHAVAALLYGRLLEARGNMQEGLAMKLTALEREPFSPLVHLEIAMSYFNQRCYDGTIEWAEKTLRLDPHHSLASEARAGASLAKGDGRLRKQDVSKPRASLVGHAESYGDGVLEHALQRARAGQLDVSAFHLAVLHGAASDRDRAFRYLNQAIESRDPGLLRLAVAPQWDNLRTDRRFNQCLARMGLNDSGQGGAA